MNERLKSRLVIVFVLVLVFVVPFFWRKYRDTDIENNGVFVIGRVTKKTGSLINGKHWHYEFRYKEKKIDNYKPTHTKYNVHIGDYFLIMLSKKNPNHNKILYDYKLRGDQLNAFEKTWNSWHDIPDSLFENIRKD